MVRFTAAESSGMSSIHRDGFAVFDVGVGTEMVPNTEMQADQDEVWKRPTSTWRGRRREHRSHGTRSQADKLSFVVGRAFWEQRGSVTGRSTEQVEQGASVEVLSLLLGKSTSQLRHVLDAACVSRN